MVALITLPSSFLSSDSYIVRVKAVVMTRDDSSGGWLAQDGGALSRVGVCRLVPTELAPSNSQFLIRGERLRDKQVKHKHFGKHIKKKRDQKRNLLLSGWCRPYTGDPGLSAEEESGVHHSNTHVSPLEGGGQEVRSVLPESSRRQSFRQGGTESDRGPG